MGSSVSQSFASPLHLVRGWLGKWRCTVPVHELAAEGKTQADIIRILHIHPHTVRKYLRMPTFVAYYRHPHPTPREPYRHYLEERGPQGEVMLNTLWRELQARGFRGVTKASGPLYAPGRIPQG
jgi:transposase